MDAASKRISLILDSISAEQDGDDAKLRKKLRLRDQDDIMPSYVFNRSSRSFFGSLIGSRRRRKNHHSSSFSTNGVTTLAAPGSSSGGGNSNSTSLSRYGLDIAELDPQSDLPAPIADLLYFLKCERKCLRSNEDIFQVRTSAIDVKCAAIVKAYNEERLFRVENIGVDKRDNIAAAFGAVVHYFEAMPRPLIPYVFMNFVLSQDWYRLSCQDDVTALRDDFVERLPLVNYRILRKLMSTLRQMSIWAFDKQGEEAPVWLVSTFRRHWTFYSTDKPTNNAIYVASFVALTVFRSGLGRFSPDNESLFHFRASCFLAQLMINFNALFVPKRKKVSLPASIAATSTDKCGRNEVGYENEQVDLRLQQINALSAHLGRIIELSNQMSSIGDDAVNRVGSVATLRKRLNTVAARLDALGIDILVNAKTVVKSTESIGVQVDKHNLFTCHVSLASLQSLLFNIRLDTTDYKTASLGLNLRDYLNVLVNIEGAIVRLVARRFLETTDALAERMAQTGEFDDAASEVELVYEPVASSSGAPVLRHDVPSPAFLSPASFRKQPPLDDENNKSEEVSLLMGDAVVISNNANDLRDVIKTPSPSSDVEDLCQTEEVIEITKRFILTGPDETKVNNNSAPVAEQETDSSSSLFHPERTPTPEIIYHHLKNADGGTTGIIIENKTSNNLAEEDANKNDEVTSGVGTVSSRRSSSSANNNAGETMAMTSPRRFVLDEEKISAIINNSSRPQSSASASISSSNSSNNNRVQIPGLHLGALHQGQNSPLIAASVNRRSFRQQQSSPRTSSRSSFCSSNRASSGGLSSQQKRFSYMPSSPANSDSRSATIQRKFQPSLETNV